MNRDDREYLVQKIRTQYTEKEHTQLDALRELDARVKRPAKVFSCIFGAVSAVVMGCGMSLVMTDVGRSLGMSNTMAPGIIIGAAGLLMAVVNYPIHKGMLNRRKSRYADRIMKLSDQIMGDQ
ncbi:MAG: hypothetical protein ACI4XQ_00805 [Eubacteriales bacterium]